MLSKEIEKRCAIYSSVRTSPSSQVGIIDTPALNACTYQTASADTRMRANASDYVCDRLRTKDSRHLRAFCMHAHVYTHTHVRARLVAG